MKPKAGRPALRLLGEGVYSVSEICRILQPSMTPRKVHYWLDTQLLGEPISRGRPGHPTLLSFQQLLAVRTIQHLRDELDIPLTRVRVAFSALDGILTELFGEDTPSIRFARGVRRAVVVHVGGDSFELPVGQGVLSATLPELNRYVDDTRAAWESRSFDIPDRPTLVSNARVLSGAPVIKGTRVETAAIAALVEESPVSKDDFEEIHRLRPGLSREAIVDALEFEGLSLSA